MDLNTFDIWLVLELQGARNRRHSTGPETHYPTQRGLIGKGYLADNCTIFIVNLLLAKKILRPRDEAMHPAERTEDF